MPKLMHYSFNTVFWKVEWNLVNTWQESFNSFIQLLKSYLHPIQGCSYSGRRRAGPPSTHDFRPAQPKKKRFPPGTIFFFFFFLVPGTMFHNRGSIIAQYTYVIYIENDLVRLWIPAGALPLDPRSLALRFIGFTHSAYHYYSQLFSTTQIGLATTLILSIGLSTV